MAKTENGAGTSPRRRNREQEMRQAALSIFARKGYDAASVQDVADAIGVLKGSVYHYIDSKEDLLFDIFHQAHEESEELMRDVRAMDIPAEERLRLYLERLVRNTLANTERSTLYFRDWRSLTGERLEIVMKQRREYDLFLRKLISEAYGSLGLESAMSTKFISSFVSGGANWVADWYRKDGPEPAENVARSYAQLALAAITGVSQPASP